MSMCSVHCWNSAYSERKAQLQERRRLLLFIRVLGRMAVVKLWSRKGRDRRTHLLRISRIRWQTPNYVICVLSFSNVWTDSTPLWLYVKNYRREERIQRMPLTTGRMIPGPKRAENLRQLPNLPSDPLSNR